MYQGETGINHRHWRTGEALGISESPHTAPEYREGRTHRVPLHELLLSHVEPETIRYGKHVVRADVSGTPGRGSTALTLADGEVVHADLVVAADGIYSVRSSVKTTGLKLTIPRNSVGNISPSPSRRTEV
jgi:salicylate hydroxylase